MATKEEDYEMAMEVFAAFGITLSIY